MLSAEIKSPRLIFLLLIVLLFAISCEKQEDETTEHLIAYPVIANYSSTQIEANLTIATIFYPAVDTLKTWQKFGATVYKVTYRTIFKDQPIEASGLVCIPDNESAFPILSFQNGTNTCYENTPSENPDNRLYNLVALSAGSGYIVCIPDYIGFGGSKTILHPYMHRESTNQAVFDLLLAAKELTELKAIKASFNGKLFLMGYSQGGWATLSALNELEQQPLVEFLPVAAACGAGAYNLSSMASTILSMDEYPTAFYLPYFIQSRLKNRIMSGNLDTYFQEPFAGKIPDLFDGTYCNGPANDNLTTKIAGLMQPKLINEFETANDFAELRNELAINSVNPWPLEAKLRFYHSEGDKSVFPGQSKNMYSELLSLEVPTTRLSLILNPDTTKDHNDVVVDWGVDALIWLNGIKDGN